MEKNKCFQLRFEEMEHRELKAFCAVHGVSMQEFITKAIEAYRQKWEVSA